MKKISLLPLITSFTANKNQSKSFKMLLLAMLFCFAGYSGFAQVSVTSASGGTGICPTKAVGGGATAYTALGTMTVAEGSVNDLSTGANVITLNPPSGWQFNTAALPTFGFTPTEDITGVSGSFSGGNLVVTVTTSGMVNFDQFTITGLQVEATSTSSLPGYVFSSVAFVPGITTGSSGTDFADLALASPLVPSVSIAVTPTGSVCAGTNLTFTPTPTNGGATPTYQWFVNGVLVGAGSTYSTSTLSNGNNVTCTMTVGGAGSCTFPLTATSGAITASINPLPTTVTVTGGGTFCGTETVTASNGGSGTIYFQGTTSGGTSTATPATSEAITSTGTYYFRAQSGAGCWGTEGAVTVTINPVPGAVLVTGGTTSCGTAQTITASGGTGGTIYFENTTTGGTSAATPSTSQSVSSSGTYYFRAEEGTCWGVQGSTVVTVNPLPTAFAMTGGGSYCAGGTGVAVGLANSTSGVNYELFLGGVTTSIVVGGTTGSAITFGLQTGAGTYTVVATNTTTLCTNTMTGSETVTINPLPTTFGMTGGGDYCAGGAGVPVGLSGSVSGVNYQLFIGGVSTGGPVAGGGGTITFGTETSAGTYTAVATDSHGCTSNMTGTSVVSIDPLPTAFAMTGGGSYCSGGTGVAIGLINSTTGVNYELFLGGVTTGIVVGGTTGSAITFGLQTGAGTYTVVATNTTTSCTQSMTGSKTVTINTLPTVFTMTGGGSYCFGGSGVAVGLSGSTASVSYQLFLGGVATGSPTGGSGSAISFGPQTGAGTYTAVATDTHGCTSNMTGTSTISINPLPTAESVTGGGAYCSGGTGVAIGLGNSVTGDSYQLYIGGTPTGAPVTGTTGSAITFGLQTASGTYTVIATTIATGCTNNMTGSETISINPLPTVYAVTGGGSLCAGATGVAVGLANSTTGINYELFLGGVTTGIIVSGTTGSAITFGLQTTAGTYTVVATNTGTTCTNNMSGSATVIVNTLPTAFAMTGGGSLCAGATGVAVGLANSTSGVSYQLFLGGVASGIPVSGTGSAITFGLKTAGGTYTVVATTTATGCTNNMTGSEVVTVNPLPVAYAVTGGGSYCSGGTGVAVGLANSETGVNYELFLGGVTTGIITGGTTGSPITFGLQTSGGTYTVVATNTVTLCTNNMTGSETVVVNPLPTVFAMSGGGAYCSGGTGVAVGLTSSTAAVSYQLFIGGVSTGAPVTGTGGAISFGLQTAAGTYTAVATDTHGCTSNMSGTSTISINPLPVAESVTGGGAYCSGGTGVAVGLGGSFATATYQLYLGGVATGLPVPGGGGAITFGLQTATGVYTVIATTTATGCTNNMTGSTTISINPLPTAYTVTGGGTLCAGATGVAVGLSNSATGFNYELFLGGVTTGIIVSGTTGSAITFGLQTAAGNYTVVATNTTTLCTNNMTGSATVIVNPLPTAYVVTSFGITSYCSGGAGVNVFLSNSDLGVSYQLYIGGVATGLPKAGTGATINFGAETAASTYTVIGTNTTTGCTNNMSGSVTLTINPLPTAFSVTGGGGYCAGGTGLAVGLINSTTGVNYELFLAGVAVAGPIAGNTGLPITFGLQTGAGVYTVVATDGGTGCTNNMSGSATITINPLPAVYSVIGGGSYCSGSTGVHVGLASSDLGTSYELFLGGVTTGIIVPGTGASIDFGLQTAAGTYTVLATNTTTTCTNNMGGSVTISINPLPLVFNVSGGGSYCTGGAGLDLTLSGSQAGVNYQLYNSLVLTGGPIPGTGVGTLDLGFQTAGGVYTAVATNTVTSCTSNMTGSATIVVDPLPIIYAVTGGGSYCAGGTGVHIGTAGSDIGITYQLMFGGVAVVTKSGTGAALDFGLQTSSGLYTVVATNLATTCTSNMSGSATVTINGLPNPFTLTSFGINSYCAGGAGVDITLVGSNTGISYQLFLGGVATGAPMAGTTGNIDFGLQTAAGTYTAVATDTLTHCTNNMTGSIAISINPLPIAYAVTGGGAYCSGGAGMAVGVANSQTGVNYELFLGGVTTGIIAGGTTGSAVTFGLQTLAGVYTVVATNTTTLCTNNMTGSVTISINPLPTAYAISAGGAYCAGGTGVDVQLASSDTGISYQLLIGGVITGAPMAGTGALLDFGSQTAAGAYTILATNNITGCTNNMTGTATIVVNPLPIAYAVTGGGSYCSGGAGVHVGVANSETGVSYQLVNAFLPVGAPLPGNTGSALDFGLQTTSGFYTVLATNTVTLCSNTMSSGVAVTIIPLPTAYTMSISGSYCAGGTGVDVALSNSDFSTNYELFLGGVTTGITLPGTGGALDFGLKTVAGVYTVVATNTITTCTNNMAGSTSVSINPLPTQYTVSGGGSRCFGSAGLPVILSNSDTGITYDLLLGGVATGINMAGTGSPINFGLQTVGGTYTVMATNNITTCTNNMLLNAVIIVDPLPTVYAVNGGGPYCAGGAGVDVSLFLSDTGITYQLFLGGGPTELPIAGTGSSIDFGLQTTGGTYTIAGTNNITGCNSNMSGSAVVVVNPLPLVYTVIGGGPYCSGGTGVDVQLSFSDTGIIYQLIIGGTPGPSMTGAGAALDFGLQTTAGIYTVIATNAMTGCTNNMTGSATISINPSPAAITGVTNECIGNTAILSDATGGGTWSSTNTAVATIDPITGSITTVSAGTYTINYTLISTGCQVSVLDSVDALPVVSGIVGVPAVCAGNFALFGDATPGGVWSSSDTTIATIDPFGMVTGISAGTVNLTYNVTSIFGCSQFVTQSLTILAPPVVSGITGAYTSVCQGLTMPVADVTPGGVWSSSATVLATIDTTGLVSGVSPGFATISYTVTNLAGCVTSALYTLTVGNPMPTSVVLPLSGSATLCHGNPVYLYVVSAGGGLSYQWDIAGSAIPGATDSSYVTTSAGTYTAIINNGTCNETLASISVVLPPVPVIALDTLTDFLYTGSFSSYQWFLNGDTVKGATSSTIAATTAGSYTVVVSDGNGCFDTSVAYTVIDTAVTTTHVGNVVNGSDIKVYPNPATSILYIDAPVKVYVTVVSTDGKILMGQKEARSLNVGQLADGMYMIMIYDENNVLLKTDKFIKIQ